MQNYQNRSYTVQAKEMTLGEYIIEYGLCDKASRTHNRPDDKGFLVINPNVSERNVEGVDGYVSWLPEKAFHEVYRSADTWQERLLIEYPELQDRTDKLYAFLQNTPTNPVTEILLEQYRPQRKYLAVLKQRVGHLGQVTYTVPPAIEPADKDIVFVKVNDSAVYALADSAKHFADLLLEYDDSAAKISLLESDDAIISSDENGNQKNLIVMLTAQKAVWNERRGKCWTGEPLLICRIDEDE